MKVGGWKVLKILEKIVLEIIWVFNEAAIYILFGFFIVMATCRRPKEVALTTTHRMLHRHGWRKVFGSRSGI